MIEAINPQNNSAHKFNPGRISTAITNISSKVPPVIHDFCDLSEKKTMSRKAFFALAFVFLLGARYFQARDADERREVATRDFSAVITAIYAVPVLEKFAGIFINKKTGIPIFHGETKLSKNLNPEKGVNLASYWQLREWLSVGKIEEFNNEKIKGGFSGFLKNIKNAQGNLMKCFSVLDKDSHKLLDSLGNLTGKGKATNENLIDIIESAENNQNAQAVLNKVKQLFVMDKKTGFNALSQKASNYKSLIKAGSITITSLMLGILLPWFNIKNTRNIHKNKHNLKDTANADKNNNVMIQNFDKFKKTGMFA